MIKYIGKICLCALGSVVGTFVGGIVSTALHLEQPRIPGPVDMQLLGLLCLVGGFLLSLALATLSTRLQVNRRSRFAIIAWFVFAWLGLNNTIEAGIFTTLGGGATMVMTMLSLSLFVAGAVAWLFGDRAGRESCSGGVGRFLGQRTAGQWMVRFSLVVAAFPVVYFIFGMPVGLMVGKFYQNESFALQLPSLSVVVGVQFVRGLIALLAVLPVLAVWTDSRQRFAWTFGPVLFVVAGLYGLLQAYWMPWALRSIHTVELFLDSLAYSWLLAVLLLPRAPAGPAGGRSHYI